MLLDSFLTPTQHQLFNLLAKKFRSNSVSCKNNFILVKGAAPILLVAHLDTVHQEPVKVICKSADGNILMSPQGIGGDDRCGCYALNKIYDLAKVKPFLLFTCSEEIGGIGAESFADAFKQNLLPPELKNLKLIIEIDRKGVNDAVFYDCDNPDFENYISGKGFITDNGSFSDISVIAPVLGVAAVNLSSGYYNAHTLHEFINLQQLESTISKVLDIVKESTNSDFPLFPFIEKIHKPCQRYFSYHYIPQKNQAEDLPFDQDFESPVSDKFQQIYQELLEVYPASDLAYMRSYYGDSVIYELYLDLYPDLFSFDYEK